MRWLRYLPIVHWLRRYTRADLAHDLLAGTVTAILLVPQGMAFALLAGLPPQVGLYASIAPPILYALLGTSRTLAVGPVSVAALMVAHALGTQGVSGDYLSNALVLALLCGLILLVLGMLRLGVLVNFLSHPVLSGFTSAAAVLIIISQLPSLTGIQLPRAAELTQTPALLAEAITRNHPATLLLGLFSVALLVLMGGPLARALRRLGMTTNTAGLIGKTGPLVVVGLATLTTVFLGLADTVAVVGAIPKGLPGLELGFLRASTWLELLPSAALIALVGYVESISIAKALANRRRERVDPNQELIGLGAANLGAALTGGMPVAGGFSRTMVNFNAGARTQMAALITAALVGLVALAFTPLLRDIPKTVLAAIIIVAVVRLIDLASLREAWHYDRTDAAALFVTFAGVLVLGIEQGLLAGIGASLLTYVWRTGKPHIAVVGRVPGSEHFRNINRHRVETWPELLLVRVDENLYFANTAYLEDYLMAKLAAAPAVRHLVLIASAVNYIDVSALASLEKLVATLRDAGITVHLAEVKGPVMDRLQKSELLALLAPGKVFLSTHQAVTELAGKAGLAVHRSVL